MNGAPNEEKCDYVHAYNLKTVMVLEPLYTFFWIIFISK